MTAIPLSVVSPAGCTQEAWRRTGDVHSRQRIGRSKLSGPDCTVFEGPLQETSGRPAQVFMTYSQIGVATFRK